MKYFFWLSGAAYVFVYFYAAWIYDGFSIPVAIFFFALFVIFIYWRYQRFKAQEAQQQLEPQTTSMGNVNIKPLSLWRSPIPYIGVVAVVVIIVGMRL